MDNLKITLQLDLKQAMKDKDTFTRDTIRFLMSAIKQIEVDERKELTDNDILKIVQKSVKQREDAAEQYKEANRIDLYDKEVKEAELLKTYLPKQLNDDELKDIIQKVIDENSLSSMKDIGKAMSLATKACDGKADGKRINLIVKELL